MKKKHWFGLGLLYCIGVVVVAWRYMPNLCDLAWDAAPPAQWTAAAGLQRGDDAPDFTLQEVDGQHPVALHELRGRPVVMFFGSCT